jgi:hypothetical protein
LLERRPAGQELGIALGWPENKMQNFSLLILRIGGQPLGAESGTENVRDGDLPFPVRVDKRVGDLAFVEPCFEFKADRLCARA